MPLAPPNLDDRKFDDLFAEAKLRLQRYCPDWTDFNDSDPGIALVQLFAWLTDLMIYRINKIPEHNYITFLKMLNLERREARPAKTQVVLNPAVSSTQPKPTTVRVRSRFFVTAASGETLPFETTEAIDVAPYPMDAVQVFDGLQYSDYSKENTSGSQTIRPLGWVPKVGNALYLGFHPEKADQLPNASFPARLVIYFFFPPRKQSAIQSTTTTPSGQVAPTVVWEYASQLDRTQNDRSFSPDRWRPLTVLDDSTGALTVQGRVVLRGPGADCYASTSPKPSDDDRRFWIRCRLVGGNYSTEDIPEVSFIRCNVVEVENRATFQNEVVGIGNGVQSRFTLQNVPVDPASIQLAIVTDVDGTIQPCTMKDDLYSSKSDAADFTLNPNSGEIQFGDGKQGRIPGVGETLVAFSYQAGGGSAGNVAPGAIKDPPVGVTGLDSVLNPRAAEGGMDEETLERLLQRAPRILRGDARAVTKDDYRKFAEEIPGVGRAIVIPQMLPDHPGLNIPGALTIVVIPQSPLPNAAGNDGPPQYLPPNELLKAVFERIDECRTAGTEIAVVPPRLRKLDLQVTVLPLPEVSENLAQVQVRAAIEHYFQPVDSPVVQPVIDPVTHLRRRPEAPRWEIGTPIYPSRLYEVLFSARDSESDKLLVQDVIAVLLSDSGENIGNGSSLELDPDELPLVTVTVSAKPVANRRSS